MARARVGSLGEIGIQIQTHALAAFCAAASAAEPAWVGAHVHDGGRFTPTPAQHDPGEIRTLPLAVIGYPRLGLDATRTPTLK
jgi:hypothetical protein